MRVLLLLHSSFLFEALTDDFSGMFQGRAPPKRKEGEGDAILPLQLANSVSTATARASSALEASMARTKHTPLTSTVGAKVKKGARKASNPEGRTEVCARSLPGEVRLSATNACRATGGRMGGERNRDERKKVSQRGKESNVHEGEKKSVRLPSL